eukprot:4160152-Prymnesium_polylepis.1
MSRKSAREAEVRHTSPPGSMKRGALRTSGVGGALSHQPAAGAPAASTGKAAPHPTRRHQRIASASYVHSGSAPSRPSRRLATGQGCPLCVHAGSFMGTTHTSNQRRPRLART